MNLPPNIPVKIPYSGGGSYRPFRQIGSSGIVRVYRALNVPKTPHNLNIDYPTSSHRILKILPQSESHIKEFQIDYDALQDTRNINFKHPHLIDVERSFFHGDPSEPKPKSDCFVLAMEEMSDSLHSLFKKGPRKTLKKGIPEKAICFIMGSVLDGLSYLHAHDETHGSLDTWAIWYNKYKSPAIKLICWGADFNVGVLRREDTRVTGNRRTTHKICCPERRPPVAVADEPAADPPAEPADADEPADELEDEPTDELEDEPTDELADEPEPADEPVADLPTYSTRSDIWHLGLTAIELAIGELEKTTNDEADRWINAFHAANPLPLAQNIHGNPGFPDMRITGRLMTRSMAVRVMGHHFSPQFVDFVVQCTQPQSFERATAETLLRHPFMTLHSTTEAQLQMLLSEAQDP